MKLNENLKDWFRRLISKPEISILIIEDKTPEDVESVFREAFPNATTYCFEGFGVDDDPIEHLIEKGGYDIIVLDSKLSAWEPHPAFGQYGPNIIPFVLEKSPRSMIMSISLEPSNNEIEEKKGAHFSIIKSDLGSLSDILAELK